MIKNYIYTKNSKEYNIEIIYKDNLKNTYLSWNNDKKIFVLKINSFVSNSYLIDSINYLMQKAISKVDKIKIEHTDPYDIASKWFYFFGKKKFFNILEKNNKFILSIDQSGIELTLKDDTYQTILKTLKKFWSKSLLIYIKQVQILAEQQMNIPSHEIKIRDKKTSWGTNHIGRKKIAYNQKLVHFDVNIITTIVYHELAHFIHPNHSLQFWNLVFQYVSEAKYKQAKKYLKNSIYSGE